MSARLACPALSRIGAALLLASLLWAPVGCRDKPASVLTARPSTDYFPLAVGPRPIRAQLAVLEPEMQVGLMYRTSLGRNDGMLFVYAAPQPMHFWMRNTPLPLDIGYFDAQGVLREIHPLQPNDETPVSSRQPNLQFALEMNQGWFRANGIATGAKLDLSALKAALSARGFEPRRLGME